MTTINTHIVIVNKVNRMMTEAIEKLMTEDSDYQVVKINYFGGETAKSLILRTLRNFKDCAHVDISMTKNTIEAKITF